MCMTNLQPVDFKAVAAKGAYVYCYLRADGTPYYVGIASNAKRPLQKHLTKSEEVPVPVTQSRIVLLRSELTKEEAAAWECFFIDHYGMQHDGTGFLENKTIGGTTGPVGYVHTEEHKQHMKEAISGIDRGDEWRNTMKTVAQQRDFSHYNCHRGDSNSNANIRKWEHFEHGVVTCSAARLREISGENVINTTKLVKGEIKQSKGWTCLNPDKAFTGKAHSNAGCSNSKIANNAAKLGMSVEDYKSLPSWTRKRRLSQLRAA